MVLNDWFCPKAALAGPESVPLPGPVPEQADASQRVTVCMASLKLVQVTVEPDVTIAVEGVKQYDSPEQCGGPS
jgi:hypothetical protein